MLTAYAKLGSPFGFGPIYHISGPFPEQRIKRSKIDCDILYFSVEEKTISHLLIENKVPEVLLRVCFFFEVR